MCLFSGYYYFGQPMMG